MRRRRERRSMVVKLWCRWGLTLSIFLPNLILNPIQAGCDNSHRLELHRQCSKESTTRSEFKKYKYKYKKYKKYCLKTNHDGYDRWSLKRYFCLSHLSQVPLVRVPQTTCLWKWHLRQLGTYSWVHWSHIYCQVRFPDPLVSWVTWHKVMFHVSRFMVVGRGLLILHFVKRSPTAGFTGWLPSQSMI